jgi:hypothetical protein
MTAQAVRPRVSGAEMSFSCVLESPFRIRPDR